MPSNASPFAHGLRHLPEYKVWSALRSRCMNDKVPSYPNYGGRGISVCARWDSFKNFIEDVGRRPTSSHQLDRFPDNDGDYEPGNVRWATAAQQAKNTRRVKLNQVAVDLIRYLKRRGASAPGIAYAFGISRIHVNAVCRRQNHKEVDYGLDWARIDIRTTG